MKLMFNLGEYRIYFEYNEKTKTFSHFYCAKLNGIESRSVSAKVTPSLKLEDVIDLMKDLESNQLLRVRLSFVSSLSELRNALLSAINGYLSKRRKK